jgi:hypothetical protein
MTTDLYSVLPGIQPTAQEILEAELLATQILSAQYPDMDLRSGTGLRDLVVRPSAMLMALVKKGVDYIFAQNSLASVDDTTPTDLVDSILSNWFLERQLGTLSIISARLYFARSKNTTLSSSVYFSTDNVAKFYPSSTESYSSASMIYDSFSNEYYLDVELTAETEGSSYNIGSGSLLYFSNFDPYFLRAEINFLKEASILSETNSKFVKRAKTAVSTRNLINTPSIDSNLRASFNYIPRLVSIGMGDTEMVRDQINAIFDPGLVRPVTHASTSGALVTCTLLEHGFNPGQMVSTTNAIPEAYNGTFSVSVIDRSTFTYSIKTGAGMITSFPAVSSVTSPILIHNGGMVDVYCTEKLANAIVQLTLDKFGRAELTGPIFSAVRSLVSGGDSEDTLPSDVVVPYRILNKNTQLKKLISIVSTDYESIVTVAHHGYTVGRYFRVSDAVPEVYNGVWRITNIIDENKFSFTLNQTILENFVSGTCSFVIPDKDFGFSQRQVLSVDFYPINALKTVSMQLGYFQNLDSIQNYLESPANRVLCGDYLARGFNFYHLSVEILSYNSTAPDSALSARVVENYLSELELGEVFIVSDLVAQLRLNGIINIQNPPNITYKKYTRDLNSVEKGIVVDIIDPNDRTNVFLLESLTTNSVVLPSNTLVIN